MPRRAETNLGPTNDVLSMPPPSRDEIDPRSPRRLAISSVLSIRIRFQSTFQGLANPYRTRVLKTRVERLVRKGNLLLARVPDPDPSRTGKGERGPIPFSNGKGMEWMGLKGMTVRTFPFTCSTSLFRMDSIGGNGSFPHTPLTRIPPGWGGVRDRFSTVEPVVLEGTGIVLEEETTFIIRSRRT